MIGSHMNNIAISAVVLPSPPKLVGIAADHGGFELKQYLAEQLRGAGHDTIDFGNRHPQFDDDYPDYVIPLARAVAGGDVERGVAICGSGVGASVAANKIAGVRACLIQDAFSAHQGVEDDDLNLICLGGLVVGNAFAWELVQTFLAARFSGAERHCRRLEKVASLEFDWSKHCLAAPQSFLPPHGVHQQTVIEAKAEWRYEGNPN